MYTLCRDSKPRAGCKWVGGRGPYVHPDDRQWLLDHFQSEYDPHKKPIPDIQCLPERNLRRAPAEVRVGDVVFFHVGYVAWQELHIHTCRLKDWAQHGTPSGRLLRTMYLLPYDRKVNAGFPWAGSHGPYLHSDDRQWLIDHLDEAKDRRGRRKQPRAVAEPS
jgi:hypothetical protein